MTYSRIKQNEFTIFSDRIRSMGKVMFSQASVCSQAEGRGIEGGVMGVSAQGVSARVSQVSRHALQVGRPLPRDGHCRGRYASYWNEFLSK